MGNRFLIFCLCLVTFALMGSQKPAVALDLNAAYQRIQQAIQKNPRDLNLQMDLAYVYTQGLEWDRAVAIYESVLTKDPDNRRATTELCVLYTWKREADMAEVMCERAVSLDPENYLVHDNLGLSYFKLGRIPRSFRPFLRALALKKDAALVRYHLIQSFMALGEFRLARRLLENLSETPDLDAAVKTLVYHGLYVVEMRLKNYDRALEAIRKAYRHSGNSLYLGKVIRAALKANQVVAFCVTGLVGLWFCHYFGQRVNRFLKNE